MEFKEFVQLLYPIIGAGKARYEFTYLVLSKVVDEKGLEILDEIQNSSYKAYYYGNTKISVLSRRIFQYIDMNGFYNFLNDNPDEVIYSLRDSFQQYIPEITEFDVVDKITQLLYTILAEAAQEKRKQHKRHSNRKEEYYLQQREQESQGINNGPKNVEIDSYAEIDIRHHVCFLLWPDYKNGLKESRALFPSLSEEETAFFTITDVMEDIMQCLKERNGEKIADKYFTCPTIAITEIECIEGKDTTQQELSNLILNRVARNNKTYLISAKLLSEESNVTQKFVQFLNSATCYAVSNYGFSDLNYIGNIKQWVDQNLPRDMEVTDNYDTLLATETSWRGLTMKDALGAMHLRQKKSPRYVSQHRKKHDYPLYTISSFDKDDYFTIIYADKVDIYMNSEKLFEYPTSDVTGIIFNGEDLLFSKKYDNSIYSICPYKNEEARSIVSVPGFKSITILKYVNNKYMDDNQKIIQYIPNPFLVIEASESEIDFNDCHSSKEGETLTFAFDFENNKVLFPIPIAYLSDMAIPFREYIRAINGFSGGLAVLLGDGSDGTDYYDGESAQEVYLKSIAYNYTFDSCLKKDELEIVSFYDDFTEEMHAYSQSYGKMRFPLFNYLYYWLCEYSNTLSSEGSYVVYYCHDILGVIISDYRDGRVHRIFRLPAPYRNLSLKDKEGVKIYFNEVTEILTILIEGNIKRYRIIQKTPSLIDELNDCYEKSKISNNPDGDNQFKFLFYDAIADVTCTSVD